MAPRLIAVAGPVSGTPLPLTHAEISVGRDDANQLTLADPSVSPRHCVFECGDGTVTIQDLDPGNPSFVNGLPAGDRTLEDGDQIQIGGSVFVLQLAEPGAVDPADSVQVEDGAPLTPATIVMSREDVFVDAQFHRTAHRDRLSRDLAVLLRASATINAVRGLVELQRPVIELIADVVPASRGALVVQGDRSEIITSAVGWRRGDRAGAPVHVNRMVIERVLRNVVGILTHEGPGAGGAGGAPAPGTSRSV